MDKIIKSIKYIPKIWVALSYPLLLFVSLFLFLGRNFQELRIATLLHIIPEFYSHVSNFSISFIIYITVGYVGLMRGLTLKHITIIGILILLVNFVTELFITFLNTPDKIDAVFGIGGVLLGFGFLYLAKNYGLKNNDL